MRTKILDIAKSQNGVKEKPANSNLQKYGAWYGMNGVPWCAIWVSWVYNTAGHPLGHIDSEKGYHYVPSAYNHWRGALKLTSVPKPADIVLYDWNFDKLGDHTGIFVRWVVPNKSFYAWEGNTSPTSDSNGGAVMLRLRYISQVLSFVNPLDLP